MRTETRSRLEGRNYVLATKDLVFDTRPAD